MGTVLLYVPNLIGYVRIALAFLASFFAFSHPLAFTGIYTVSQILDAVDGYAARKLNQASQFGSVLDMVTDRMSTFLLYLVLTKVYDSAYLPIFACLAGLDYISHWFQNHLAVMKGEHHKSCEIKHWLMQLYYHNRTVLFSVCFLQEMCLIALYHLSNEGSSPWWKLTFVLSFPIFLLKQGINLIQLGTVCHTLASLP